MSWTCRLIENPEVNENGNVDISKREVGDMWFLRVSKEELKDRNLTEQYFNGAKHGDEWYPPNVDTLPLIVLLPGKRYFLIDGQCFSVERGYYDGWFVRGTPPNITVAPSINMVDGYHGFLRNGVITDPVG